MLIKLFPDQISEKWEVIKFAIANSLPPSITKNPDCMNNVLFALMSEQLLCWISHTADNSVNFILTTQIIEDLASREKSVLIYSAYGVNKVDKIYWIECLQTLRKYAEGNGCGSMVAYTNVPRFINIAKSIGVDTSFTFLYYPV